MNHENYLKALSAYIEGRTQEVLEYLDGPKLTQSEKILIRSRQAAQQGNIDEALIALKLMHAESLLLKAEKHFVTASLLSYSTAWQEAISEATEAVSLYQECQHDRGLFLANYNLSVYFNRLGLDKLSLHYLHESEKAAKNPSHASLINRAYACHYSRLSDYRVALQYLQKALSQKSQLNEVDQDTLDSVAADIFFRAGHSELALAHIGSLARSRIVRDKARVKFELMVLRSLLSKESRLVESTKPLVIQQSEEYSVRWDVLEQLQNGDFTSAQIFWMRLCTLLPQRFTQGFTCSNASDEKTIFMTALRTLMKSSAPKAYPVLSGKLGSLLKVLVDAPIPLRKEELIERVWNTAYSPAYDARFYKLVERLRKEGSLELRTVNYTYQIVPPSDVSLSDLG